MIELSSHLETYFQKPSDGEVSLGSQFPIKTDDPLEEQKLRWNAQSPDLEELPKMDLRETLERIKEKVRGRSAAVRAVELGQLLTDVNQLYWARTDLHEKMKDREFMAHEPHLKGNATLVFAPGLGAFRGLDFVCKLPDWAKSVFSEATYADPTQYFRTAGFKVHEVWNDGVINTGNVKKGVSSIREEVKHDLDHGPVFFMGHSIGGIEGQIFAALNPSLAEKMDGFFLGASPVPDDVNSWVLDSLLALQGPSGGMDFGEEVSDFYNTGAYKRVNFISIKSRRDPVLEGYAAGKRITTEDGHSSVLHQLQNLRRVVNMANGVFDTGAVSVVAA